MWIRNCKVLQLVNDNKKTERYRGFGFIVCVSVSAKSAQHREYPEWIMIFMIIKLAILID